MRHGRLIIPILLLLTLFPLSARPVSEMTSVEEEAATPTLDYEILKSYLSLNNTTLLQAEEDLKTASLDVKDAKANWQPQIDLQVTASYMPVSQSIVLDSDSITLPDSLASKPMIGYFLGALDGAKFSMGNTAFNAQLSITQPIITWGKIGASVDMYKEIETIRALQIGDTEEQLSAELKAYLAALYYLDQILTILDELEADADELVRIADESSASGVILSQDAAQAKVSAKQIEVSRVQIESQIDSILTSVETMTGISPITLDMIVFTPDEDWFQELASADRTQLELLSTGNSQTSIQMLNHMITATEYAKKAADRSMYWFPDLALNATVSYGGYSLPFQSGWTDKLSPGVTLTLALQTTIWDGGKKLNDQKRTESAIASATISRDEAVNTIRTTLRENLGNMDLALANIGYQEANIELLESQLELEELKYEYGSGSLQDVLSKRIELNQARIERLSSCITLAGSAYTVEYLTGYEGE